MVLSPVLAVIEFVLAGTAYILLALAFCLLGYLIFALGCRRLRHVYPPSFPPDPGQPHAAER